ncbi:MAG: regulatory protein RecX [Rubricoccaceae bacterium]
MTSPPDGLNDLPDGLAPEEDGDAGALRSGTVTRVAQQQRNPERVSVFIDGRFAFGLAYALAVEAGLRKGLPLSAEAQADLLERQRACSARAAALDFLSRRARTTAEVRRALVKKGYDADVAERTVAALVAAGYLDDAAYATAYVRGRFAGRGHGPARLRQDLAQRGIDRALIDMALATLEAEEDLAQTVRRHAAKRWRTLASEPDVTRRARKTFNFLLRQGFAYDLAREAIEHLRAGEPEAPEGCDP